MVFKFKSVLFSDSFCNLLSQHSDGSHYVRNNPHFLHKNSEKSLLIPENTYEKYIVCTDYCIAHHDDKTCFLPACEYQIIIPVNVEELLKILETLGFTYQHVDCLYTLFKYRFSGKVIAKSGQVFDNVQRAVEFNHTNKVVDRMPSIAQKRLFRKKVRKAFIQLLSKDKNNGGQWFSVCKRNRKSQKTNFELELLKIVDYFLDGHGSYDSKLVSFKIKSF